MAFTPDPYLFNRAFGGGVGVGSGIADLFRQKRDRSRLQDIADQIRAGAFEDAGAGLVGIGQVAPGVNVAGIPYQRQQDAAKQAFQREQFGANQDYRNRSFEADQAYRQQQLGMDQARLDLARQNAMYGGVPSFTSPVQALDAQGNPVFIQSDNRGNVKPIQGYSPANPIQKVDTGTEIQVIDSRTGQLISSTPKQNLQEAADTAEGKKLGERKGELPVLRTKAISAIETLDRQHGIVNDEIKQATDIINANPNLTTGLVGGISNAIPGTPAYRLAQKLKTIKANIGFDKLQSMRENSPTGGALGQVSDFENRQLQAVQGALEQAQAPQDILYNLARLQAIIDGGMETRKSAFERDFGQSSPNANQTTTGGWQIEEVK